MTASVRKFIPAGVTQVKIGGPPDDWIELSVLDLDTGCLIYQVQEINAEEGWLDRLVDKVPEDINKWPMERLCGKFQVVRVVEIESTTHVKKDTTG